MSEQDEIRLVAMRFVSPGAGEPALIPAAADDDSDAWDSGITEEERRRLLDYVRGWVVQYPPKDLSPEARLDDRIAAKLLAKEDSTP